LSSTGRDSARPTIAAKPDHGAGKTHTPSVHESMPVTHETESRRQAGRLALALMAASAVVTLLIVAGLWMMVRRLL
jgi:hypothetical protein